MAVKSMVIRCGPPTKRRPKIGDRKTTKDGTVLVRRQCYTRWGNQWCGQVQNGRPVAEWVPEGTPLPWEVAELAELQATVEYMSWEDSLRPVKAGEDI